VSGIGILIVDADAASQRALKNVFDYEGWRVRIVPHPSQALEEIATGGWNLVIVNMALADLQGPLFSILKDLALADSVGLSDVTQVPAKRIRVLFLVPVLLAKDVQPILEREGLPYSLKPYPLNDLLEKVSELLVESGALAEPLRSIGGFSGARKRPRDTRFGRDSRKHAMFASREDYQMTEEEIADFEREEAEDKKKREKVGKEPERR
jgi:DNA-binding response OmpR family regulator